MPVADVRRGHTAAWTFGKEIFTAGPGTAIRTPPNAPHQMRNTGEDMLELLEGFRELTLRLVGARPRPERAGRAVDAAREMGVTIRWPEVSRTNGEHGQQRRRWGHANTPR